MEVEQFIALGFFVIRAASRPSWAFRSLDRTISEQLLPDKILSLSPCLCHKFPGTYAIEWCSHSDAERIEGFEKVSIQPELRAYASDWATTNFDNAFGYPDVFYSYEKAKFVKSEFFLNDPNVYVVGVGLEEIFVQEYLKFTAPPPSTTNNGYFEVARKRINLPYAGKIMGFELLNVSDAPEHSWICNGLEEYFARTLGIMPTKLGLLKSLRDARQCLEVINRGEVGAEPGPWFPFVLVDYGSYGASPSL